VELCLTAFDHHHHINVVNLVVVAVVTTKPSLQLD
jgi:hypothetical protein